MKENAPAYQPIPREQLLAVRQADLAAYLIARGEPLKPSGACYKHAEHDSLVYQQPCAIVKEQRILCEITEFPLTSAGPSDKIIAGTGKKQRRPAMNIVMQGTAVQRNYDYAAFISYRHQPKDTEVAKALHRQLETYTIPRAMRRDPRQKHVGKLFRDQDELPLSADLGNDIRAALDASEWLIVVCSPEYNQSKWCMAEIDYFIQSGRRGHILTVLVAGEPRDSFPEQLRFAENVRSEIEPLAADVRADAAISRKRKVRGEKLRLLAPMLDVQYDDLRQRAKRRLRQRIAVSTCACLVLLVAIALMFGAQQRKIAAEQVGSLLTESGTYWEKGEQGNAVRAALRAYQVSKASFLDERPALSALYNAQATFPTTGPFARLQLDGGVKDAVFSGDGTLLAVLTEKMTLTVFNAANGLVIWEQSAPGSLYFYMAFTPDHGLVYSSLGMMENENGSTEKQIQVLKFDSLGNHVFTANTELFSISQLMAWDRAGYIVVQGNYSNPNVLRFADGDESEHEKNNFCLFIDQATGEITNRFDLGLSTVYEMQLSNDGTSLCAYSDKVVELFAPEVPNPLMLQIFTLGENNSVRKDFRTTMDKETLLSVTYLGEDRFVRITEHSAELLHAKTGETEVFCTPDDFDIEVFGEYMLETLKGPEKDEFVLVLARQLMMRIVYDAAAGQSEYVEDVVDLSPDGIMVEYGWADPEINAAYYISETGLYVEDAARQYQGINVELPKDYTLASVPGCLAVMGKRSDICLLYNIQPMPNPYYQKLARSRYQYGQPYFDLERGLCVLEGWDDGGVFFELVPIGEDGQFGGDTRKVYLPGTEGFDFTLEDTRQDTTIRYGKDYAVIVRRAEPGETSGACDVYALDYETAAIQLLPPVYGRSFTICNLTEEAFLVRNDIGMWRRYDLAQSEVGALPWDEEKLPEDFELLKLYCGPDGSNKLCPFFREVAGSDCRPAVWDCQETGSLIVAEQTTMSPLEILWSPDAATMFFVQEDQVCVFDTATMELRASLRPGGKIRFGQALGDDWIAVVCADHTVTFYDARTLKRGTQYKAADTILSITWNEANQLCVVASLSALAVLDCAADQAYFGPVRFATPYVPEDTVQAFLANDKSCLLLDESRDADKFEVSLYTYFHCHSYGSIPLLSPEDLLESAARYTQPRYGVLEPAGSSAPPRVASPATAQATAAAQPLQKGGALSLGGRAYVVLDIQDDKALVISEDVVELRPYHDWGDGAVPEQEKTWAECSLRGYLNGDFYESFPNDEKARIHVMPVLTDGTVTQDRVFILSYGEVEQYFAGDMARFERGHARKAELLHFSEYPKELRAWISAMIERGTGIEWWLRSSLQDGNLLLCSVSYYPRPYYEHGTPIDSDGNKTYSWGGVRPCMWIQC